MAEAAVQEQQQQKEAPREAPQRGARWLHRHPTEDQVRAWFAKQPLHDEMPHDRYVSGVVLIGANEKSKVTKQKQNGDLYVTEQEYATFTPYMKVDTRIAYWWDLVRLMNERADDDKYIGIIEPVPQRVIDSERSPYFNAHLPEGYSIHAIKNSDESVARFIVATWQALIYERESYARRINGSSDLPVLSGRGSKQVGMARKWADENSMMKAETGAIGRALGVAGILVVGTGVATAEDVQEARAAEGTPVTATEGVPDPEVVDHAAPAAQGAGSGPGGPAVDQETTPEQADDELRDKALGLQKEMEAVHPEVWEAYKEWWRGRGFGTISELNGPALRGAVIKLERDLDAAKNPPKEG